MDRAQPSLPRTLCAHSLMDKTLASGAKDYWFDSNWAYYDSAGRRLE